MSAPVDVLVVLEFLASHDWDGDALPGNAAVAAAVAAVAELIAERDALAKWQREVTPLLRAAQSWMPTRKCAASIREIDAALARCKGGAA